MAAARGRSEALQKNFQRHFIQRGAEIESYLASNAFIDDSASRSGIAIVAPAMAAQFGRKPFVVRVRSVLEAAFLWNVWTLYCALLFLCILAHFFLRMES